MIEDYLYKLNANPFIGGKIIQSFYNGYNKGDCPLAVNYLILPIVLFEDTRNLFQSYSNGSLLTLIENNEVVFIDLQKRVWQLNELTNLSLIALHNQGAIKLKNDVEVIKTLMYSDFDEDIKKLFQPAHFLGKALKEFELKEVFQLFKIIP
jgi:hypothetical protein